MNKQNSQYDFVAKLLIIGESGVGKTCLLLRFCEGQFTTTHIATIGKHFKISNNRNWFQVEEYRNRGKENEDATLGYCGTREVQNNN